MCHHLICYQRKWRENFETIQVAQPGIMILVCIIVIIAGTLHNAWGGDKAKLDNAQKKTFSVDGSISPLKCLLLRSALCIAWYCCSSSRGWWKLSLLIICFGLAPLPLITACLAWQSSSDLRPRGKAGRLLYSEKKKYLQIVGKVLKDCCWSEKSTSNAGTFIPSGFVILSPGRQLNLIFCKFVKLCGQRLIHWNLLQYSSYLHIYTRYSAIDGGRGGGGV